MLWRHNMILDLAGSVLKKHRGIIPSHGFSGLSKIPLTEKHVFCTRYTGWWLGHPSEKYESVGMIRHPIYGNIKNVPNHQPVYLLVGC